MEDTSQFLNSKRETPQQIALCNERCQIDCKQSLCYKGHDDPTTGFDSSLCWNFKPVVIIMVTLFFVLKIWSIGLKNLAFQLHIKKLQDNGSTKCEI